MSAATDATSGPGEGEERRMRQSYTGHASAAAGTWGALPCPATSPGHRHDSAATSAGPRVPAPIRHRPHLDRQRGHRNRGLHELPSRPSHHGRRQAGAGRQRRPALRGSTERYNPEELLVAALAACHMLAYLALCARGGVCVTGYDDRATGTLSLDADGGRLRARGAWAGWSTRWPMQRCMISAGAAQDGVSTLLHSGLLAAYHSREGAGARWRNR